MCLDIPRYQPRIWAVIYCILFMVAIWKIHYLPRLFRTYYWVRMAYVFTDIRLWGTCVEKTPNVLTATKTIKCEANILLFFIDSILLQNAFNQNAPSYGYFAPTLHENEHTIRNSILFSMDLPTRRGYTSIGIIIRMITHLDNWQQFRSNWSYVDKENKFEWNCAHCGRRTKINAKTHKIFQWKNSNNNNINDVRPRIKSLTHKWEKE